MELENKQDAQFSVQQPIKTAAPIKRIVASLINSIALYAWIFLLVMGVGAMVGLFVELDEFAADETLLAISLFSLLSFWAMQIYLMVKHRQTLGKWLMKIQVADYQSQQPISFGRYFGREFTEAIIYAFLSPVVIINVIMLFANKDRRTLTDMLFSTVVVDKR